MANQEQTTAVINEKKIENQCTDVTYPQVEGLKNQMVQDKINAEIQKRINTMIPAGGCDVYASIVGKYEVGLNQKGILSIKFIVYSIRHHAANGLDVQKSLTINLENAKVYQLHELFKPGSDYRIQINKFINNEIKEKDIPLIKEFKGISDYQDYYLTEDALVIYFQEIEYTPHYYGILEFTIPYVYLRNLINEEGPIARLVEMD